MGSLAAVFWIQQLSCEKVQRLFPTVECSTLPAASVPGTVVLPSALQNVSLGLLKGGIPKVVHQIWWSSSQPRQNEAAWMKSWSSTHPGWLHVLWRESDLRPFMAQHHPKALPLFDSFAHIINKIDMVRYFILWIHGGLYVDIDFEALSSMEPQLESHGLAVLDSPWKNIEDVQNSMIASRPNHPFWLVVFSVLEERSSNCNAFSCDVMNTTGPGALSEAVRRFPSGSTTQPKDFVHRLASSTCMLGEGTEGKPVAKHHFEHMWFEANARDLLQRYAACMFVVSVVVVLVLTLFVNVYCEVMCCQPRPQHWMRKYWQNRSKEPTETAALVPP